MKQLRKLIKEARPDMQRVDRNIAIEAIKDVADDFAFDLASDFYDTVHKQTTKIIALELDAAGFTERKISSNDIVNMLDDLEEEHMELGMTVQGAIAEAIAEYVHGVAGLFTETTLKMMNGLLHKEPPR